MIVRRAHIRLTRRQYDRQLVLRADAWGFRDYPTLAIADSWLESCEPVVETAQLLPGRGPRVIGKGYESPLEVRGHVFSDRIYTRRPVTRREDEM